MAVARVVPRVPDRRRWWALAGSGALLVGVVAAATGWALGSGDGWVAVPLATIVVLAAVVLFSAVRGHGAGRSLRCDDGVLAGRTLLGWHGVDLTEVQEVAAEEDEGEPTGLLLVDGGGHLRCRGRRWRSYRRCACCSSHARPRVRWCCPARSAQPGGYCRSPDAPETGRVPGRLRDPVEVVITGLTVVGALVSGLVAALVALH